MKLGIVTTSFAITSLMTLISCDGHRQGRPYDPVEPQVQQQPTTNSPTTQNRDDHGDASDAMSQSESGGENTATVTVPITQLAANIRKYDNQTVQTTGQVDEVLDERAFSLEVDRGLTNRKIYVIDAREDSMAPLASGSTVQIEGTVRRLSMNDLRQIYGVDLRQEVFVNWLNRDIIIADDVEPLNR